MSVRDWERGYRIGIQGPRTGADSVLGNNWYAANGLGQPYTEAADPLEAEMKERAARCARDFGVTALEEGCELVIDQREAHPASLTPDQITAFVDDHDEEALRVLLRAVVAEKDECAAGLPPISLFRKATALIYSFSDSGMAGAAAPNGSTSGKKGNLQIAPEFADAF